MRKSFLLLALFACGTLAVHAQDTAGAQPVGDKYLRAVTVKSAALENKLDRKTAQLLRRFEREEDRLLAKYPKSDTLKLQAAIKNKEEAYRQLKDRLTAKSGALKRYIPSLDTLSTSLKFLQQNPQLLKQAKATKEKLAGAMTKVKGMEDQFQKAEQVKQFIKERQQYFRDRLSGLGLGRQLKQLNKQAYYYGQQLNEYKAMLKDHKKAETKAVALLSRTKLFKDFMRKNSQLASMFRLPEDPSGTSAQASLAGLQTRAQVSSLIQQRVGTGGPAQAQQNIQQAQGQLQQLRNKLTQLGKGSSDDIMPGGFKPNDQKTKSFLRRLEFGANIQSQRASGFFPTTSDIGLSIGYKLNDRSRIGIGGSYKVGWGRNIQHISISHQGIGLRSYVDWKIKGSFWLSGGYEMNYRSEFKQIEQLKDLDAWQASGLIGVSKIISLKTKFFRQTKLQLLWNFLSERQVPRGQAVVFRVGYSF